MPDQRLFPPGLLQQPPNVRKEYFKNFLVKHDKIKVAADEILRLINDPADTEVIHVVGPSGVGKSTLMRYLMKKLTEATLAELENDPGRVPVACITAQNPETGAYDWKEHYFNTLLALDEILIDRKIFLPEDLTDPVEIKTQIRRHNSSRAALRRAAQMALKNRRLSAFFVDEAHHITKRRSGQSLIDHADTIRMIASLSGTIHVLLGTYDLLALRNLNGQLGRRSHTVHFGRYGSKSEDVESFTRAFLSFQAHLPVAVIPNLIQDLEFCYLRCLGCIGLLKNWFMRSLVIAIEDQRETVDLKLFRSQATPNSVCLEIAQEIRDGESRLEEKDDEFAHAILRELLGSKMSPGHVTRPTATRGNDLNVQTGATQLASTSASGGKRGRVGRKPKRYPVGKTTDES
jgi:ABC-type uncharacterized transport system YnjBCD ATPase subunit